MHAIYSSKGFIKGAKRSLVCSTPAMRSATLLVDPNDDLGQVQSVMLDDTGERLRVSKVDFTHTEHVECDKTVTTTANSSLPQSCLDKVCVCKRRLDAIAALSFDSANDDDPLYACTMAPVAYMFDPTARAREDALPLDLCRLPHSLCFGLPSFFLLPLSGIRTLCRSDPIGCVLNLGD